MLVATNITFAAGKKTLLRHATLELRPGELLALVGENGAGKSTLLKVMTGDLSPQAGSVRLNARPLHLWSLRDRARIRAILPQDGNIAFGFSVLETVLFGRYPHGSGMPGTGDREIARAALGRVDATHLSERDMHTLSGGERARVMLARVLAQIWEPWKGESRYLLLDEPTASLDLAHQHEVLAVARMLAHNEGIGLLAVLHDLNLAAQSAHRLVALKSGAIVAEGTPEAVLTEELVTHCFSIQTMVMRHPRMDCPLIVPVPR